MFLTLSSRRDKTIGGLRSAITREIYERKARAEQETVIRLEESVILPAVRSLRKTEIT